MAGWSATEIFPERRIEMLQQLREEKKWSRSELSRHAGVNTNTVGQIESGRLIPYDHQLIKIVDALEPDSVIRRKIYERYNFLIESIIRPHKPNAKLIEV